MKTLDMAREAWEKAGEGWVNPGWFADREKALKEFEALVRADEREACAKLVEPSEEHRRDASWGYMGGEEGVVMLDDLAAAIRARSTQ